MSYIYIYIYYIPYAHDAPHLQVVFGVGETGAIFLFYPKKKIPPPPKKKKNVQSFQTYPASNPTISGRLGPFPAAQNHRLHGALMATWGAAEAVLKQASLGTKRRDSVQKKNTWVFPKIGIPPNHPF